MSTTGNSIGRGTKKHHGRTETRSHLPRYIEHLSPGFAPVFFHIPRLMVSSTCARAVRRAARVSMVAHMEVEYSGRVRDAGSRGGRRTESVLHCRKKRSWTRFEAILRRLLPARTDATSTCRGSSEDAPNCERCGVKNKVTSFLAQTTATNEQ